MVKRLSSSIALLCCVFGLSGFCISYATTATIPYGVLIHSESNPPSVKKLILNALHLANQNLSYRFGSASPLNKGMDCSGTMHYLLNKAGLQNVPRQSDELYRWVWQKDYFHAVSGNHFNTFEFAKLKPGYLLFWTGTYPTTRSVPVTHVMLYLGMDKYHQPIMFGASEGRLYASTHLRGVSVFNFILPSSDSKIRFIGYSCIPHLSC